MSLPRNTPAKHVCNLTPTQHYIPPDAIVYDDKEYLDEQLSDDDSVVEELAEQEPLTYTDLNDSLHEVVVETEKLRTESALSPVEEDTVEPEVIEPEVNSLLLEETCGRPLLVSFNGLYVTFSMLIIDVNPCRSDYAKQI